MFLNIQVSLNTCGSVWKGEAAFKYLKIAENFKSGSHGLDKIQYGVFFFYYYCGRDLTKQQIGFWEGCVFALHFLMAM